MTMLDFAIRQPGCAYAANKPQLLFFVEEGVAKGPGTSPIQVRFSGDLQRP
jgi:hypothetical protein